MGTVCLVQASVMFPNNLVGCSWNFPEADCGRQISRWPPMIFCLLASTSLYNPSLMNAGRKSDLLLTERCYSCDYVILYIPPFKQVRTRLSLAGSEEACTARNHRQRLRAESGPQLIASRKWGPWSYNCK